MHGAHKEHRRNTDVPPSKWNKMNVLGFKMSCMKVFKGNWFLFILYWWHENGIKTQNLTSWENVVVLFMIQSLQLSWIPLGALTHHTNLLLGTVYKWKLKTGRCIFGSNYTVTQIKRPVRNNICLQRFRNNNSVGCINRNHMFVFKKQLHVPSGRWAAPIFLSSAVSLHLHLDQLGLRETAQQQQQIGDKFGVCFVTFPWKRWIFTWSIPLINSRRVSFWFYVIFMTSQVIQVGLTKNPSYNLRIFGCKT